MSYKTLQERIESTSDYKLTFELSEAALRFKQALGINRDVSRKFTDGDGEKANQLFTTVNSIIGQLERIAFEERRDDCREKAVDAFYDKIRKIDNE